MNKIYKTGYKVKLQVYPRRIYIFVNSKIVGMLGSYYSKFVAII